MALQELDTVWVSPDTLSALRRYEVHWRRVSMFRVLGLLGLMRLRKSDY